MRVMARKLPQADAAVAAAAEVILPKAELRQSSRAESRATQAARPLSHLIWLSLSLACSQIPPRRRHCRRYLALIASLCARVRLETGEWSTTTTTTPRSTGRASTSPVARICGTSAHANVGQHN